MRLSALHLTNFRNYESISFDLPSEGVLFYGPNGSGKTNLLEAIHLLCLGRSQRGATWQEMIRHGEEVAGVEGTLRDPEAATESRARIGFSRDKRVSMVRDGRGVNSFREWFSRAALVSFGPDDVQLVSGPPSARRRFLDMLICQIDPAYLERLLEYQRALRNRNRVLAGGADEALCEVYEAAMASHGTYLCGRRAEVIGFCQPEFESFHANISGGRETGSIVYRPCVALRGADGMAGERVFSELLKSRRKQDAEMGFSAAGPHRDDIIFLLDRTNARSIASQGQCRSLALSLRLSSVSCIRRFKNSDMIFLVDDAFSELDDARVSYLYPLLRGRGQVFMTTPSERLCAGTDLARFVVASGTVAGPRGHAVATL